MCTSVGHLRDCVCLAFLGDRLKFVLELGACNTTTTTVCNNWIASLSSFAVECGSDQGKLGQSLSSVAGETHART